MSGKNKIHQLEWRSQTCFFCIKVYDIQNLVNTAGLRLIRCLYRSRFYSKPSEKIRKSKEQNVWMVRKISLEFLSAISLKFFTSFQNNNAAFRCHYCQEPRERLQRSNDVIIIQNGARQERAVFDYRFCVFFYLALLQK